MNFPACSVQQQHPPKVSTSSPGSGCAEHARCAEHAEHAVLMQFDLDIGDQDTSGKTLPHLREMTFNMITGEASSRRVADTICDFPRVPLDLVGDFKPLMLPIPSCYRHTKFRAASSEHLVDMV